MQQLDFPQPADAALVLFVLTENVESCASSLPVWQLGHSAFSSPKRMASNLCPHDSHRYSKIGITTPINSRSKFAQVLRAPTGSVRRPIDRE
jgi:hypothetical protein